MSVPLKLLVVEDNPSDAALLLAELRRAGYAPQADFCHTEADFLRFVQTDYDVILSDFNMPQFSAPRALELLAHSGKDTPLIVVSGSVGEDTAADVLKQGATDYLLKDRLARLGSAIERALARRRLQAEKRQAEADLLQSREFNERITDACPLVIFVLDLAERRALFANRAIRETLGYAPDEILQMGTDLLPRLVHPEDLPLVQEGLESVAGQPDRAVVEREFRMRHANGEWRRFHGRSTVFVRDHAGAPRQIVGLLEDITERHRLEEQLRQSQKMEAIGQLAGGVAHDFNNVLTVIIGYTEMLLTEMSADHAMRPMMTEVRQAGQRAAGLTRQLLAFSRKQILEPRVLDLNAVVRSVTRMLERLIGEHIHLKAILDPHLNQVRVDPGQIEQVVVNLAVNARDAMPSGGTLTIETRNAALSPDYCQSVEGLQPGPFVLLSVTDNGTGMSKEIAGRVFEPFFTTKQPGQGTGLGLSTVYGIVKQSQGHISVYSEPGLGTTFKVYLPATGEHADDPQAIHSEPNHGQSYETILLVEDDDKVRKITQRTLAKLGYQVLEAAGSRAALELAAAHKGTIHLLLTDVVMPDMNGRELAEALATTHPQLPVLYVSGYANAGVVRNGLIDPLHAYLHKPFTPTELARKVRECIDRANQPADGAN
jgi:PAS domain S-box-containing protein